MTLNDLYRTACQNCKKKAQESSCAFDVSLLFEHVMGISRYRLPLVGQNPADAEKAAKFLDLCGCYAEGYPLQYLLGEWEFFGLPFKVGEGVLIPRPDTEILVETALELLKGRKNPVVADLCAGSGCIAAAIAYKRPDAKVFALELSEAAFPYLRENIARNQVEVQAIRCDVFAPPELPLLDLAVSNPPYIPRNELEALQKQVTFEPEMALFGGEDGYHFYRRLPAIYYHLLKPDGAIAFETGYNQAQKVSGLLLAAGYGKIGIRKDLAGIERVVFGQKS
ncbi:MAG: peptide chain release factor N(5)-glutamine methyltransferase [Ruminococcaceae bacterium]|nr:peptide chain release factor N(5)-glutamine methyltransferase [Oscillospiraceae bacterium]